MTAEQLEAARAERMRQNGHGATTIEDVRTWIEETGLCIFLPRSAQAGFTAPTFVEAIAGQRTTEPTLELIATAEALLVRLEAEGVAVRLNLSGQPGDQPDYVVAGWVLPYIYALRGDRDWRRSPQLTGSRQVSQLAVQAAKQIDTGNMTAMQIRDALGREVTETAVLRALHELWKQLRIIPVVPEVGSPALWQPLRQRFQKAIAEGASTSQVTAISVLASIYLQAVIAASMEDVEMFLSPLTSRSKIREVVRGLAATRQVHSTQLGHSPMFYVAGTLPEFPAVPSFQISNTYSSYRSANYRGSTYLGTDPDQSHDDDFGGSIPAVASQPISVSAEANVLESPAPIVASLHSLEAEQELPSLPVSPIQETRPVSRPMARPAIAAPSVSKSVASKPAAPRPRAARPVATRTGATRTASARGSASPHPRDTRDSGDRRRAPAPRASSANGSGSRNGAGTNGSGSHGSSTHGTGTNGNGTRGNGAARPASFSKSNGNGSHSNGNGLHGAKATASNGNGSHSHKSAASKPARASWSAKPSGNGNGHSRGNGNGAKSAPVGAAKARPASPRAASAAKPPFKSGPAAGSRTAKPAANGSRTEQRGSARPAARPATRSTAHPAARPAAAKRTAEREPVKASATKRYSFSGQAKQAPKPAAKRTVAATSRTTPSRTTSSRSTSARTTSARPAAKPASKSRTADTKRRG